MKLKMKSKINEFFRLACISGDLQVIKYYIEKGVDIHINNDYPLQCASRVGDLDVVKYLVEKGANIHALDDFPLQIATDFAYYDVLKVLTKDLPKKEQSYWLSKCLKNAEANQLYD